MRLLVSSPLRPLAGRMRALASRCVALDVITAFVSLDAVKDTLEPALEAGATVRFLTGTFGNVTRAATFRHLHALAASPNASVRIWDCGTHGNLHAKLYVWRREDGRATVWIGSANLTDGGLQNEGELVAEVMMRAGSPSLDAIDKAFEREWRRGRAIDEAFLKAYREAARGAEPIGVFRRRRRRHVKAPPSTQRMFVATASAHFSDDGVVATRVDELLGGSAEAWYRGRGRRLEEVRPGDWCLYIDTVDGDVGIVAVTDVVRDGDHVVFAHEALLEERPAFTKRLREELAALGLRRSPKALFGQWVPEKLILAVARRLYPNAGWGA